MDADIVRMTSKGQLVIPQDIRESLHLQEGDKFIVIEEGKSILLRPLKELQQDISQELYAMTRAARAWKNLENNYGEEWTIHTLRQQMKK